jgi:hypothetical protein
MALCAFGVPLKDAGGRLGLASWLGMVDDLDSMIIMVVKYGYGSIPINTIVRF